MAQHLMGCYKQWLQRHEVSLGFIESTLEYGLEGATWLVASRSDGALVLSEACAAAVDLWKLLNESILRPGDQLPRWLAALEAVRHRRPKALGSGLLRNQCLQVVHT